MRMLIFLLGCAVFGGLSALADGDLHLLPQSDKYPRAILYDYFPSRLHAYVFRNWTSVKLEHLANTIDATPQQIREIAAEMGLPEQPEIQAEWGTSRGYITVLRRNWHLLNYRQLLKLLKIDARELQTRLRDDDFLFVKLGNIKPQVGELSYAPSSEKTLEKARRFAAAMKKHDIGKILKESKRFAFLDEFASAKNPEEIPSWQKDGENIKIAFSYFSDYCDPLMTDTSYPDGLLCELAKKGVNGVWLHVVLSELVESDGVFMGSDKADIRISNLNRLIKRADKYGIKVWLYLNEPRPIPDDYFEKNRNIARFKGAIKIANGTTSLCTSRKEVLDWLSKSVEKVFGSAPGLGGTFIISESENLVHCLGRKTDTPCSVCEKRGRAAVVSELNNTIKRAVKRGAPDARVIVWNWAWERRFTPALQKAAIDALDNDIVFMSVSEIGVNIAPGGVKTKINEYSLSACGPSDDAKLYWDYAARRGHKKMAKVQVNASWEFASVPALPVLKSVATHARNLRQAGVNSYLLSWSLGGYPSENIELFTHYDTAKSVDENLFAVAEKYYGKANAEKMVKAWTMFSDSFAEYPFNISSIYMGAHNVGIANPVFPKPTKYRATMVGFPYDDFKSWSSPHLFSEKTYIKQIGRIADGFAAAMEILESVDVSKMDAEQKRHFLRAKDWAEIAAIHFKSVFNQSRYITLRDRNGLSKESSEAILNSEESLVKRALPIVLRDSHISYESSNHYYYTAVDLFEKLASIEFARAN